MRCALFLPIPLLLLAACSNFVGPKQIKTYPTDVAFIGNSFQDYGLDFGRLRSELGCEVDALNNGGAETAWMYATFARRILADSIPGYVVMTFEYNDLTCPLLRTAGVYATDVLNAAGGFPQIMDTVNAVLQQAGGISNNWDFDVCVASTFVPRMIDLAQQHGVQLVFQQMRNQDYVQNPQGESEQAKQFRDEAVAYMNEHGAIYLDYSFDPEIGLTDFVDGHHLNRYGQVKWTRQVVDDMRNIFWGKPAYHQLTGRGAGDGISISQPTGGQSINSAHVLSFETSAGGRIKWSYKTDGDPYCETYLGAGSPISCAIPPYDHQQRTVWVYAYDGQVKQYVACSLVTDTAANLPPTVSAGPDLVSYIGRPTAIHAVVSDDHLDSTQLTYQWSLLRGSATLSDTTRQTDTITPTKDGLVVVSVTVSDGVYARLDVVSINVNIKNQFDVLSLTQGQVVHPGDTVIIYWQVVDVTDCEISVSYDAGLTFTPIPGASITTADSTWEQYPWIVASDAPDADTAYLKLSTYDGTVTGLSRPFSIQSK